MHRVLLLFLLFHRICGYEFGTSVKPLVATKYGLVEGQYETTARNKTYASFLGIPFAKPPLGELRFKSPLPVISWNGILTADKQKEVCVQLVNSETTSGSENCLYLNIYSPKRLKTKPTTHKKLPVMVYIHGGAYIRGSSKINPDPFLENNIVVASITYRLGIIGFLSLDEDISGNAGLKDQVAALRWIKENIAKFGGDEDNITIFGLSAGGSSVSNLQLSPMSKGLFNKVIAMSGTALTPWGLQRQPEEMIRKLSNLLQVDGTNKKELLKTLQFMDVSDLIKTSSLVQSDPGGFEEESPFAPVIEKHNNRTHAFFTKEPIEYITSRDFDDVPTIFGYSSKEYLYFSNRLQISTQINRNITIVPKRWRIKYSIDLIERLARNIRKFYFGQDYNVNIDINDNYERAVDLLSDITFILPTIETARVQTRNSISNNYLYRFSYRGTLNQPIIEEEGIQGATHGDDLTYCFTTEQPRVSDKSSEGIVRKRLVKMFVNFAKTGNPTPGPIDTLLNRKWLPITENANNYLEINGDIVPSTDPEEKRRYFWEDLEKRLENGEFY